MTDDQAPPQPPTSSPPPPPPAPPPGGPPAAAGSNRTVFLVLSYLGILALIPFLMEKEDREVQWHAKHGLVLTVFWFILFTGLWIVEIIASQIWGMLGCFMSLLLLVASVGILVFHLICIYKAVNGERQLLPGISDFADRF